MRRRVYIKRPKSPDTSAIDRINELSKIARTNWFALLAYLSFAGVTLLGVQDADFFIDSRRTKLPLVDVEILTRDFFVFGPILGCALFVYLHLYLLKLWEALADAPPRPKGEALSLQVTPWLINDLGLALRRDNAFHRRPMDWLSHLVTFTLVFAVGPIVIGYFWVRYWPAHELGYSIFNAFLFTLATMTMLSSLFTAVTRLRYGWTYRGGWWHLLAAIPTLAILLPALVLTIAKTDGPERLGVFRKVSENFYFIAYRTLAGLKEVTEPIDPWNYTDPYTLRISPVDLKEVEFTPLPTDWLPYDVHRSQFRVQWCALQGLSPEVCGIVSNDVDLQPHRELARRKWCEEDRYKQQDKCENFFLNLESRYSLAWRIERTAKLAALDNWSPRNSDLRNADMSFSVTIGADLRGARLEGADLRRARLEGADLRRARLEGANLLGAQLEGVNLSEARLEGADLRLARLEGANLSEARLEGANLSQAQLQGADLVAAQLEKADLFEAQLKGAKLVGAQLDGAFLSLAQLEGADLLGAQLEGADLSAAQLEGADLFGARLEEADLSEAELEGANLSLARLEGANLSEAQLEGADLRRAQLKGADLSRAQLVGAKWAGAAWSAPAHAADFRGGINLRQDRLMSLIGSPDTLLPYLEDLNWEDQLFIPSCWETMPKTWTVLVTNFSRHYISENELREWFLCQPGTVPQKTGTPWPLDQPPPWETDPDWEPLDRGPVSQMDEATSDN